MSQELLQNAKNGDLGALKQLIHQSFAKHSVSVKNINLEDGNLKIELRSIKGEIDPEIIERIRNSSENLKIKGVEQVEVFQAVQISDKLPRTSKTQGHKIVSKPPSLWSQPWVKGFAGLVVLVALGIPAFNFYQEQAICKTKSGEPAHQELSTISSEWQDSLELAENVNRIGMPNQISQMQSIRRDLENTDWNECSAKAVDLLATSMQSVIDAFVLQQS